MATGKLMYCDSGNLQEIEYIDDIPDKDFEEYAKLIKSLEKFIDGKLYSWNELKIELLADTNGRDEGIKKFSFKEYLEKRGSSLDERMQRFKNERENVSSALEKLE